jgi:predicted porin
MVFSQLERELYMNKKLLAVAVAGTLVAPATAFAEANWYGRINTAVAFIDGDEGDNVTDIRNISSRFGVKGSEDLGNGLSAIYRYEFGVASDVADVQDNNRLSYVGLSGSFGTVTLGRVWSAFFNHVGTIMDPSQNIGGDGYAGPYRTSNTVSYSGGSGPIAMQVDLNLDGDNANSSGVDAWQAAGTWSTGGLSIALAYENVDGGDNEDSDRTGVAVKYSLENFWVGAGYTNLDDGSDDDQTGAALLAGGGAGDFSWWASLESLEDDDAQADGFIIDDSIININLTRHLSKNARVYIEAGFQDKESGDINEILFGVRADF